MRCACLFVTFLAGCFDSIPDGVYEGAPEDGCTTSIEITIENDHVVPPEGIANVTLDVIDGSRVRFAVYWPVGERVYSCMYNNQSISDHSVDLDASWDGTAIVGTVRTTRATYAPPNCFRAASSCDKTSSVRLTPRD